MNLHQIFNSLSTKHKKKTVAVILGLIIFGIIYNIYNNSFSKGDKNTVRYRLIDIETAKPEKSDVDIQIDVMGTISYRDKATISSKILGRIEKIFAEQGDHVKKGQILTKIETLPLEIDLKSAIAEQKSAEAAFRLSKEKRNRAKRNIEREMKAVIKAKIDYRNKHNSLKNMKSILDKKIQLHKIGGVTDSELESLKTKYISSLSEFLTAKKNYEIQIIGFRNKDIREAGFTVPESEEERKKIIKNINIGVEDAEVDVAYNNLQKLKTEIEKLQTNINEAWIRSPIDGIIAVRKIEQGERIKQDSDLFVVINISAILLILNINEKEIGKLKKDQKVEFKADAVPGQTFNGRIFLISPIIDTETRTVEVKVIADNPDNLLKPGMFARASILIERVKNMIRVPEKALLTQNGKYFVFVVKQGAVFKTEIKTGHRFENSIEVISGLTEDDRIAVSNIGMLKDTMKVNVIQGEIK